MEKAPFIRQLSSPDNRPNAMHFAFCNALMFTLVGIAVAGIFAVYKVMYMFLTPLLWATLVGTILFPLKRRCNDCLNGNNYDFVVMDRELRIEALALYIVIKLVDYGNFISIIGFFGKLYNCMDAFVVFYTQPWMLVFTILYSAGFLGWIFVQNRSTINKKLARLFSVPVWQVYLAIICSLCIVLFAARHDWLILMILILGLFAVLRNTLGVQKALTNVIVSIWQNIASKLDFFVHIFIAGHIREFIKLLFTSDRTVRNSLRSSLDMLSSIFVMCFLAFTFIFMIIFSAVQLHSEASNVLVLTSNVIAKQPEWILKSARNYTQDTLSQHDIDSYVDQVYMKGREMLAENVRRLVDPNDVERADRLEQQITQVHFVDKLYRMWEERGSVAKNATFSSNYNIVKMLKSANITALKAELINIMKENVETILNVLRSLWNIVVLNISLMASLVFSLAGILVGFGLNVVNFFIEVVVFITAVYYLLISSKDRWIPLKWISDAVPSLTEDFQSTSNQFSATDVTSVIENAISGVFVLSAKMAIFYGLYTYFVHSLFDLEIVFIPSILATLFGAIPIMAPYTVSIIGLFELLLVRGEYTAALIFILVSVAPVFFAEPAFYKELKGSHPYVTGLSIVGGMYWLGLQGAIFGPLLLCSVIVLFNIYAKYTKSTTMNET
uniref:Transmembrane protein n=1 Tax=Syphacia muris TaxID=451379 RepID=A0A158R4D6_9BILA